MWSGLPVPRTAVATGGLGHVTGSGSLPARPSGARRGCLAASNRGDAGSPRALFGVAILQLPSVHETPRKASSTRREGCSAGREAGEGIGALVVGVPLHRRSL